MAAGQLWQAAQSEADGLLDAQRQQAQTEIEEAQAQREAACWPGTFLVAPVLD